MTETEKALWGLLDDIDTASDMFKPKHTSFYRYVMKKVEERHKYIISDGYNLFPCEDEDESITNKKGVVMEARELTIGSKRFTQICWTRWSNT